MIIVDTIDDMRNLICCNKEEDYEIFDNSTSL